MDSYIIEAIDKLPEEMTKSIKLPAGKHLLKVDNACVKLCKRDRIILHQLVSKLISLSKRARPDIQPKIAFLTTRMRYPDKEDWKNLQRLLSYLDATINRVKIHLKIKTLNVVHWWVDTSYGKIHIKKEKKGQKSPPGRVAPQAHQTRKKLTRRVQ